VLFIGAGKAALETAIPRHVLYIGIDERYLSAFNNERIIGDRPMPVPIYLRKHRILINNSPFVR